MASNTKFLFILFFLTTAFLQRTYATSYAWNGTSSADWATSANWTPNGVPSTGDEVTITNTGNSPELDGARTIATLTMTSGTLDLSGFTLNISTTGTFTSGTINNGTVNGASATTLAFNGTTFGASLTGSSTDISLSGGTYNSSVNLTKTGAANTNGSGGCTFNSDVTLTMTGTGEFRTGVSSPDTYEATATFINTSSGAIRTGMYASGTHYKGKSYFRNSGSGWISIGLNTGSSRFSDDIELENTSTGYVSFGEGTATTTIDDGANIVIGSNGFVSGTLNLNHMTWGGTTARSLTLTGTAKLILGTGITYNMEVTFSAGGITLNGGTFNKEAKFTKTSSAVSDNGAGGCTFNDSVTFVYNGTGSTDGQWQFGRSSADIFEKAATYQNSSTRGWFRCAMYASGTHYKGKVYIENTAGGSVSMGYQTGSVQFSDDVEVENTSTGSIYIGESTATATIADGKNIIIGSSGFTSGTFTINNFTPGGTTARSLTLTGSAKLVLGSGSVYNMPVTFTSPAITLNGGTYNKEAKFDKTGASVNDNGSGGCTFNDSTTFVLSGTGGGQWQFARVNPDIFEKAVTYINSNTGAGNLIRCSMYAVGNHYKGKVYYRVTGTGGISIGYQTGSTRFSDDVELESTSTGYITFGESTATVTIDDGANFIIGSNGFATGTLTINNFTPGGSAARSLTLTGSSILKLGTGSLYNMDVTFTAPGLYLDGGTYNGTANFIKTGSAADNSTGGCTFNGTTTLTHNGTGEWRLARSTADDFNADMFYVLNSGSIFPAYTANTTYAKSMTITNPGSLTFGKDGGAVVFDGSAAQSLNGNAQVTIKNLTVNNTSSTGLTLNTPVLINGELVLTDGIVFSSSSNLLSIADDATSGSGSAASFVDGPMKKIGDDDFVFPLGDLAIWARLGIAGAGGSVTDEFTAQYLKLDYPDLTVTGSLTNVSYAEYWTLSRDNGTSSKTVQLFWEDHSESRIANPASTNLRVAHYNGTDWEDAGHTALTSGTSGSVTSASVSSFSPFTFGSFDQVENPLPVELLSFTGHIEGQQVALQWETATEINNDFFILERSSNGRDGYEPIAQIQGQGTTYDITSYQYTDTRPLSGPNFYRLKQTDYDGSYIYSNPVQVTFDGRGVGLPIITQVYPNPASTEVNIVLSSIITDAVTLSIYNSLGEKVYWTDLNTTNQEYQLRVAIPIATLPAGTYIIRSQSEAIQGQAVRFVKY